MPMKLKFNNTMKYWQWLVSVLWFAICNLSIVMVRMITTTSQWVTKERLDNLVASYNVWIVIMHFKCKCINRAKIFNIYRLSLSWTGGDGLSIYCGDPTKYLHLIIWKQVVAWSKGWMLLSRVEEARRRQLPWFRLWPNQTWTDDTVDPAAVSETS